MRLDTRLTADFIRTAALATIDGYNEDVPSASFQPGVLKRFAEQLDEVDEPVVVSIQNLSYSDAEGGEKALIGRVEGTDVACVAAPFGGDREGDA